MPEANDEDLIEASLRGEREAFGQLVERCADMVRAVAYAATGDRALSDDIAQETFAVAWRDLERLRDARAVRPWLCRIARNIAHKARRRAVKEVAVSPTELDGVEATTPFDALREHEIEGVVSYALARIPEMYREALVLFYYEQRSVTDVATALGVSEQVVHKRLSRGRRYLADGIERLVEAHLAERRGERPRRELALLVVSALPWRLPPPASAVAKKGSFMNLGYLGMAAAAAAAIVATGHGVSATPRDRAAPHGKQPSLAETTVKRTATPRPGLPTRSTCASAAQHIVAVSLERFTWAYESHARDIERVTQRLERLCRDEAWDASDLECVQAADETYEISACRPKPRPVEVPALKLGNLTCSTVGNHMARLMIAELEAFDGDVAGSVLTDPAELPANVVEACERDEWSAALLRCYAGTTRFKQTVTCNVNIRDAE